MLEEDVKRFNPKLVQQDDESVHREKTLKISVNKNPGRTTECVH